MLFENNTIDRVNKLKELVTEKIELLEEMEYTDREYIHYLFQLANI